MKFGTKPKVDIRKMRAAGHLVAEAFELLEKHIEPGVTLLELDHLVEDFILNRGAETLYKGYRGGNPKHPPFPGVICASVNEVICHGIPTNRALKKGDIIGIDIGLRYQGHCGDACVTFPVGEISDKAQRLLEITQECLRLGIEVCRPGAYLSDIGEAIETYAESEGVSVVREWGGHGIGRDLHEPPSISHVRSPTRGYRMKPGMIFTIEPMINLGSYEWKLLDDEWTVETADGSLSAQFEHTVAITEWGREILSRA